MQSVTVDSRYKILLFEMPPILLFIYRKVLATKVVDSTELSKTSWYKVGYIYKIIILNEIGWFF